MSNEEIEILRQQLTDAIAAGDDAVELSSLAGMLMRLGDTGPVLTTAVQWRDGALDTIDLAFDDVDFGELVEDITEAVGRNAADEEIEEALFDFDEIAVGAWWAGQADRFDSAGQILVDTITSAVDIFKPMSRYAEDMADKSTLMGATTEFSYWVAIANSR